MKKICLLLLCVLIMLPIIHAETIDISTYTNEQLIDLQSKIMLELSVRTGAKKVEIPSGTYIAGIDFPSGIYSVRTNGIIVQFIVYQNEKDMKDVLEQNDDFLKAFTRTKQHIISEEDGIGKIEIEDGNILTVVGSKVYLFPYSGLKIN